jgi:hypothetical protein
MRRYGHLLSDDLGRIADAFDAAEDQCRRAVHGPGAAGGVYRDL